MGVTKTENFSAAQNEMASYFKALAHPARVAIIDCILKKKSCICNDLVGELPLSQATISQHLKELKKVGIIKGSIEGTSICYCINAKVWEKIKNVCSSLFSKFDGCC